MGALKLQCVQKIRDGQGNVVEYIISDGHSYTERLDRQGVKRLLKDKRYDVINLQIDKLGRVVEKPLAKSFLENAKMAAIFDSAYKWITTKGMVWIKGTSMGISEMSKPFNLLSKKMDVEKLQSQFESYIYNKYGVKVTKLKVEDSKNGWYHIEYGVPYTEFLMAGYNNPSMYYSHLADTNIQYMKISCSGEMSKLKCSKRVATVKDTRTGKVYENTLLGVFLIDGTNQDAIDFVKEKNKVLDEQVKKMHGVIVR